MMEPEIDKKAMGLYPKYDVIKRTSGELVTEPVFVLNPQSDPIAMVVLDLYASLAFMEGYEPLAHDVHSWVFALRHDLSGPALAGVDEWSAADFLTRVKLAKSRIETLGRRAREKEEEA